MTTADFPHADHRARYDRDERQPLENMKKVHTLIIGAGPGGLTCAELLAHHGREVLVLERKSTVGPKVCAGGITAAGLPPDLPADLLEQTFARQHIFSDMQNIVLTEPNQSAMVSTIDRQRLGSWMLAKTLKAGASVRTAAEVREIGVDHVVLRDGERIGFDHLVGADGSTSLVRRHLGLDNNRVGVGVQYHLPHALPDMEWHLSARYFANGYGWIFPHRHRTSVGAYVDRRTMPARQLQDNLRAWATDRGLDLSGVKPEAFLINFDFQGWRFGRTFLVGDAAGLASGLTGEGIYPAMLSGKTVAMTIINDQYRDAGFTNLLKSQQRHRQLVELTGTSRVICRLVMESLVLGLRWRIINFSALEMAAKRGKGQ